MPEQPILKTTMHDKQLVFKTSTTKPYMPIIYNIQRQEGEPRHNYKVAAL